MNTMIDKQRCFKEFLNSINNCDLCERMCNRKKVMSEKNGNLNAKVLFLAEAPGRLGAECTGIPLYGDKTGNNFELLLGNIGWKREDVFISNAVLCNPQDDKGNNATPTTEELLNCSIYLKMLIALIEPEVVVTLGIKALDAIKMVEKHNFVLKEQVAQPGDWYGRKVFPLYHMGPRAVIHRNLIQQRADFIKLMHFVDPIEGIKIRKKNKKNIHLKSSINSKLHSMVYVILSELKEVTFFKLTKLLYLSDYLFLEKNKRSISGCIYLRMQEGPWIPTLKDVVNEMNGKNIRMKYEKRKPILEYIESDIQSLNLTDDEKMAILETCKKYKSCDDRYIKIAAYKSKPMLYILSEEKKGRNMIKVPVIYKDATVLDYDQAKE